LSVIRIKAFGGLVPRSHARELPDDAAQTATNLEAGTREFRPLAEDTTVVSPSGVTDPVTIWRLQRNADGSLNTVFTSSSNWRVSARETSAAKGQLNDDLTDRHYYTYNDAAEPPRWLDATGKDRQLGVPAPTSAPTVVVNEVDEYTPEDRNADLEATRTEVLNAIRTYATAVWRGATHPGTATTGYTDRTTALGFDPEDPGQKVRWYRLSGAGGTISDAYSALDDSAFSWVMDPALPTVLGASVTAVAAWAGAAGTPHIGISYPAYGLTYDIDTTSIRTALAAIQMPGQSDVGVKIFTSGQIDTIIDTLDDYADPTGAEVKPKLDALAAAAKSLESLLDGGQRTSLAALTQAFYSKTDVAAEVTTAIENWADLIWTKADAIARSSLPADYGHPGNQP
jgi:hypothetical protein